MVRAGFFRREFFVSNLVHSRESFHVYQELVRLDFMAVFDYKCHGSDHFPQLIDLKIPNIQSFNVVESDNSRTSWNFCDKNKTDKIYGLMRG